MIKRIVEIGHPRFAHMCRKQMVIEKEGEEVGSVPIEDIGVLILDDPGITCSVGLLRTCWQNGVAVLVSDEKHLPGAMLVPFTGHVTQTRSLAAQVNLGEPTRKRLWQQIIRAKLRAQARTAKLAEVKDTTLLALAAKVRSGDPDNYEAQGARLYWQLVFGTGFRRDPDLGGINGLLNYGYAILRACTARSIVASGLHPSIGIHHHGQYDPFTLANDLMEPFRPSVDLIVYRLSHNNKAEIEVTPETKPELLSLLYSNWHVGNQLLPLMIAMQSYTASIRDVMLGERKTPLIPVPAPATTLGKRREDDP